MCHVSIIIYKDTWKKSLYILIVIRIVMGFRIRKNKDNIKVCLKF